MMWCWVLMRTCRETSRGKNGGRKSNKKMNEKRLQQLPDICWLGWGWDFCDQPDSMRECVVRWGCGENPFTPLWLVVDASELFALVLMTQFLHHEIIFLFIFILFLIIYFIILLMPLEKRRDKLSWPGLLPCDNFYRVLGRFCFCYNNRTVS